MKKNEAGFTYIDVLCAMTILLVGVLALAGVLVASVVRTRDSEQQVNAKQLAASTMEAIMSARDMDNLGWNAIGNVGSNIDPVSGKAQGVFLVGFQPVYPFPGADGLVGTADDATDPRGNTPLPAVQRQITITDINDPDRPTPPNPIYFRRVDVTVQYLTDSGVWRQETMSTVLTNYQQ